MFLFCKSLLINKPGVLILVGPEPAIFLHEITSSALVSAAVPNFAAHNWKTTEYFSLKLSGFQVYVFKIPSLKILCLHLVIKITGVCLEKTKHTPRIIFTKIRPVKPVWKDHLRCLENVFLDRWSFPRGRVGIDSNGNRKFSSMGKWSLHTSHYEETALCTSLACDIATLLDAC